MRSGILCLSFLLFCTDTLACTSWSTTQGNDAVLLVKNRDQKPNQKQAVILHHPRQGYNYLALVSYEYNKRFVRAGINQAGLAVTTLAVSSLPKSEKKAGKGGAVVKILSHCASINDVLKQQQFLFGQQKPDFYMLADKKQIAFVEVSAPGKYKIIIRDRGYLCHTNHFISPALVNRNEKNTVSSRIRLQRTQQLLLQHASKPWSFTRFVQISRDQTAGPNNSIWRMGTGGIRTLATFAVRIPKDNSVPTVYVYLASPGQMGKNIKINLTPNLWQFGGQDKILLK